MWIIVFIVIGATIGWVLSQLTENQALIGALGFAAGTFFMSWATVVGDRARAREAKHVSEHKHSQHDFDARLGPDGLPCTCPRDSVDVSCPRHGL